ncbi:MAG TPA: phosphohistidine phosphatase SixA [Armatimonadota bacterium]|jgi:phosphohistidine phosphatase SixA
MQLYFVRHGAAGVREEWAGSDDTRPLTKAGKTQIAHVADALVALDIVPDVLLTSPLTRAAETADILAARLHLQKEERTDERLAPGFNTQRLKEILAEFPEATALVLVGHEPDFSRTIGEVIGGRIVLKKGGLALVELTDVKKLLGELLWLVPPKLLKR